MQNLRNELEQLFTPDFFPATKDQMMQIAMQDASDEVLNYIYELENDESFKYNSIDDILPQENYVDYPIFKKSCGDTFHVKLISDTKAVTAQYSEGNIEPNIFITLTDHIKIWANDFDRSTEAEFKAKCEEVMSLIKLEI